MMNFIRFLAFAVTRYFTDKRLRKSRADAKKTAEIRAFVTGLQSKKGKKLKPRTIKRMIYKKYNVRVK